MIVRWDDRHVRIFNDGLQTAASYKFADSSFSVQIMSSSASSLSFYFAVSPALCTCCRREAALVPNYAMCDDLVFGRVSFKGFNPQVEVSAVRP